MAKWLNRLIKKLILKTQELNMTKMGLINQTKRTKLWFFMFFSYGKMVSRVLLHAVIFDWPWYNSRKHLLITFYRKEYFRLWFNGLCFFIMTKSDLKTVLLQDLFLFESQYYVLRFIQFWPDLIDKAFFIQKKCRSWETQLCYKRLILWIHVHSMAGSFLLSKSMVRCN